MPPKPALVAATAIALTGFDLPPANAASEGIITAQHATEIGTARRWRRGDPAVPFAAFGALSSAMVSLSAAAHRRDADYGPYYGPHAYGASYTRPVYTRRGALRASPPVGSSD